MPAEKKIMFQARLQRRLLELDIHSFDEYAKRLFDDCNENSEFRLLADFISTNKTEFFREKDHFDFLSSVVFPAYLNEHLSGSVPRLNVWSAGCSNGQEAYSIAIQLEEFMRSNKIRFDYSVLATDISARMLKLASEAIYPMGQVDTIPIDVKHRYFLKSKDNENKKVRVVKEIRDQIKIGYLNLMEELYPFQSQFDVVFIRNTLIYFDQKVQLRVLIRVLDSLKSGGYLFIGHSESLVNLQLPIKSIAPSVYVKL